MSQDLKSNSESHRSYADRQRAKRLADKKKRIFLSIAEYEAQEPEQPLAEREE
jgi:hypothetical protein